MSAASTVLMGMLVAMVMRAAGTMFVSMVMRAACAVFMRVLSLGGVVMRAALVVFMLMFGLGGMVVRTTGTVLMLMFSGTMVMGASFAMLMLMAGFSRIHGRIRQSGNKA